MPADGVSSPTTPKVACKHDYLFGVHNPFTHLPKDKDCAFCNEGKMIKPHATRVANRSDVHKHDEPKEFAARLTADTLLAQDRSKSYEGSEYGQVMYDVGTKFNGFYDQATKTEADAILSLNHFVGPNKTVKQFYSDNAPELMKAAKVLPWPHDTSAPEVSQTNGLIERKVRILEDGVRTILLAAGLYHRWWPWAGRYFSSMRNFLPLTLNGKSP